MRYAPGTCLGETRRAVRDLTPRLVSVREQLQYRAKHAGHHQADEAFGHLAPQLRSIGRLPRNDYCGETPTASRPIAASHQPRALFFIHKRCRVDGEISTDAPS